MSRLFRHWWLFEIPHYTTNAKSNRCHLVLRSKKKSLFPPCATIMPHLDIVEICVQPIMFVQGVMLCFILHRFHRAMSIMGDCIFCVCTSIILMASSQAWKDTIDRYVQKALLEFHEEVASSFVNHAKRLMWRGYHHLQGLACLIAFNLSSR